MELSLELQVYEVLLSPSSSEVEPPHPSLRWVEGRTSGVLKQHCHELCSFLPPSLSFPFSSSSSYLSLASLHPHTLGLPLLSFFSSRPLWLFLPQLFFAFFLSLSDVFVFCLLISDSGSFILLSLTSKSSSPSSFLKLFSLPRQRNCFFILCKPAS